MAVSAPERGGPTLTYPSLEEAALAFAKAYYPLTRISGSEWYANLYQIPHRDPPEYYYDDTTEGDTCSVALILPLCWVESCRIYAGNIHTHPAGPRSFNRFSIHDITAYQYLLSQKPEHCSFEGYLATQQQIVYRYNPNSEDNWRLPWEIKVGEF